MTDAEHVAAMPRGELSRLANEAGLYAQLVRTRLRLGWSLERALTTPPKVYGDSVAGMARAAGLGVATLYGRLRRKIPMDSALKAPSGNPAHKGIAAKARAAGIAPDVVYNRLYLGWPEEKALNTPIKHKPANLGISAAARTSGITRNTLARRMDEYGMTLEEAVALGRGHGGRKRRST